MFSSHCHKLQWCHWKTGLVEHLGRWCVFLRYVFHLNPFQIFLKFAFLFLKVWRKASLWVWPCINLGDGSFVTNFCGRSPSAKGKLYSARPRRSAGSICVTPSICVAVEPCLHRRAAFLGCAGQAEDGGPGIPTPQRAGSLQWHLPGGSSRASQDLENVPGCAAGWNGTWRLFLVQSQGRGFRYYVLGEIRGCSHFYILIHVPLKSVKSIGIFFLIVMDP